MCSLSCVCPLWFHFFFFLIQTFIFRSAALPFVSFGPSFQVLEFFWILLLSSHIITIAFQHCELHKLDKHAFHFQANPWLKKKQLKEMPITIKHCRIPQSIFSQGVIKPLITILIKLNMLWVMVNTMRYFGFHYNDNDDLICCPKDEKECLKII